MGPQRDPAMSGDHPEELLALYILRLHQGKGFGRRLLNEVRSELPFTAWVLAGNTGAERFYAAMGGRALRRATEEVAGMNLTEILLSFPSRADAP
jgi:GNAT superfamily N-acetyltransferase